MRVSGKGAYDGGRLCVFSDDFGLVLGLFGVGRAIPVGIARRGANVSGTTASDRVDGAYSVGVDRGLAATGGRKVVWAVGRTGIARDGGAPDIAYPASPRGLLCKVRLGGKRGSGGDLRRRRGPSTRSGSQSLMGCLS